MFTCADAREGAAARSKTPRHRPRDIFVGGVSSGVAAAVNFLTDLLL